MGDLVEFLEARIAEDEAMAGGAVGNHWDGHYYREVRTAVGDDPSYYSVAAERQIFEHWDQSKARVEPGTTYRHIANWDPARIFAECAAKRAIVALFREAEDDGSDVALEYLPDALRALAAVYADHPDYRQEWAV